MKPKKTAMDLVTELKQALIEHGVENIPGPEPWELEDDGLMYANTLLELYEEVSNEVH